MEGQRELLQLVAAIAGDYLESLERRPVFPQITPDELRETLGGPLPEHPVEATQVITELAAAAEPGVVAMRSRPGSRAAAYTGSAPAR
jgi:hypothetical protein